MAYTQSDLDALQVAIAKGARRIRMNGEEVEFRSLTEMRQLETKLREELGQVAKRTTITPATRSGWR